MSGWNPLTNPIDYILLAGSKSPGLAEVAGADAPRKWDERPGYGLSGAFVVYTGDGLAKFCVRIHLFTVADWDEWNAWKALVQKAPIGARPRALDIWHPFLEDLGVKSVVVENRMQPVDLGAGEWVHEIKFIQFRLPTPGIGKPVASQAAQEPADFAEQWTARLTGQVHDLAPDLFAK
jgi:hypothetical protein